MYYGGLNIGSCRRDHGGRASGNPNPKNPKRTGQPQERELDRKRHAQESTPALRDAQGRARPARTPSAGTPRRTRPRGASSGQARPGAGRPASSPGATPGAAGQAQDAQGAGTPGEHAQGSTPRRRTPSVRPARRSTASAARPGEHGPGAKPAQHAQAQDAQAQHVQAQAPPGAARQRRTPRRGRPARTPGRRTPRRRQHWQDARRSTSAARPGAGRQRRTTRRSTPQEGRPSFNSASAPVTKSTQAISLPRPGHGPGSGGSAGPRLPGSNVDSTDDRGSQGRGGREKRAQITSPTALRLSPSSKRPPLICGQTKAGITGFLRPGLLMDPMESSEESEETSVAAKKRLDRRASFTSCKSVGFDENSKQDRAEKDMIDIATRMGIVRQPEPDIIAPQQLNTSRSFHGLAMAKPQEISSSISPLGIQLKVLTKLADSVEAHLTTAEVVNLYILPRTQQKKERLIDQVPSGMKESPTLYVVHSWQANFTEMVHALDRMLPALKLHSETDYIWIDIFCVNQNNKLGMDDLLSLSEIQASVDKTIVVLDRFGTVMNRTWVQYELWQASILTTPESKMIVLPTTPWAWLDISSPYLLWTDVGTTKSSNPEQSKVLLDELKSRAQVDNSELTQKFKSLMISASQFEVQRSEKLALINAPHYIISRSTLATLLYLDGKFSDADEIALFQLAQLQIARGVYPEAETTLQKLTHDYNDPEDEIYLEGLSMLVDVYVIRKAFTKAEMQCRKLTRMQENLYGAHHLKIVKSYQQMASISMSQKIYDEAKGHIAEALKICGTLDCQETELTATCYHLMAACCYFSKRHDSADDDDGRRHLQKAMDIRQRLLGDDHPETLETRALKAQDVKCQPEGAKEA
eukprot:gene28710-31878_t